MIDPRMMASRPPMQGMMSGGPPMMPPTAMQGDSLPFNLMDMSSLLPFPEQSLQEAAPPPPPDLSYVINDARDEEDFWRPQKERMWLDDRLYHMKDARRGEGKVKVNEGTRDVSEFAALNDLRVIADKFGNRIGRQDPSIQVPGRDVDDTDDAQEIENYLRWMWKDWGQRHILCGGKMPLLRQEALSSVVRGWIAYRVWFDPEDQEEPFMLSLFDPMYVYPRYDKKGIKRVLVIRDMTLGEVLDDYPEFTAEVEAQYANPDTGYMDRKMPVQTIAYYDRYYHGFIMQNGWVKEPTPHGMGCCPWVCVPNQGGIFEAPYGEGGTNDWTEYYGDSVFASLRDPFRVMVRLYSALLTQVAKDANPPIIITTRNGNVQADSISTGVGAVTVINDADAKIQPMGQSVRPGLIETAVSGVKSSIAKGSIPDIEWGHDMNAQSGFARVVLSSAADDVFSPVVVAIQIARAAVSKIVLEVVKKHEISAPMVAIKKGVKVGGQRFSFESVVNNGTYVEFTFQQLTPQDMVAMGSLVVNLVRAGILSMETAMGDKFLGLENPSLETEKKIREKALFDPRVMEILLDYAMQQDPTDPLSQAWQQKQYEQKMMQMLQASMAGGRQIAGGQQQQKQVGSNTQPRQMNGQGTNPTLNMAQMANAGGMQ
jgi:hypothetical protein